MTTFRFKVAPVWRGPYNEEILYDISDEVSFTSDIVDEITENTPAFGNYRSLVKNNNFPLNNTSAWSLILDLSKLEDTTLEGKEFNETFKQNEAIRVNNEDNRIQQEIIRNSAEQQRLVNENNRKNSETARNDSETIRKSNENSRKENETTRISNENTRKTNENTRISNENTRQNNEITRQSSENVRVSNENERNSKETIRINNEQTRQNNETIRQEQEGSSSDSPNPSGSRWARYKQAEADRNTIFNNSEQNRTTTFNSAESLRQQNEQVRQSNESTRQQQEGSSSDSPSSSGSRWARYKNAEQNRESTFTQNEGTDDDIASVEGSRWARYKNQENTRNNVFSTNEGESTDEASAIGSRWARFNKAEEDRDALVEEKVVDITRLQEEKADIEDLENGEIIPAFAGNFESWAGSTQNANYTQENVVETTGGDLSINSSVPATLMSIAAKTDFSATKLIATGFNLLRHATAVGNGWYFMVPALPFGTINTATQSNGVLFTNSQGENLRPTVYFKPLSGGVPISVTDGTACAYTDASTGNKNYRFFTTSQAGYLIVSGIDRTTTCAHLGWSKRYDEYIAIDNPNDAGSEVDIAAGIHALHSYDKMLTVGNSADRIEKSGDSQIMWHRLVDRVQPTWTNTPVESDGEPTGDYIHAAVISGMKADGAVAFETLGITLLVDGTTISFTDSNATVEDDYVKYELATEATGTATVTSTFAVEDWGLIIIQGAVGSAYINIAYAQGIPDSVRQMLSNIDNKTIPVIAEAMLYLYNENKALRELLTGKDNAVLSYIKAQTIDCNDILTMGVPDVLVCSVTGAPSVANVPDNWDETTMTVWNGCPRKVGQQYVDKESGKVYYAIKVTGNTSDWVILN